MQTQNKKIEFLTDQEIIITLELCAELFGTTLRESAVPAYLHLLKERFRHITDTILLKSCTDYAAQNSFEHMNKFSPMLLSSILKAAIRKPKKEYEEIYMSEVDKEKYRQLFLTAIQQDFEDYCNGKEPSRVYVWRYVCRKLKEVGIILEQEYEKADKENGRLCKTSTIGKIPDNYKNMGLKKLKEIAMKGEDIVSIFR